MDSVSEDISMETLPDVASDRKHKSAPDDAVILKSNNKSHVAVTEVALGTSAKPVGGEGIENRTPPHSPMPCKAVEALRKEPRAKMSLSPNKSAVEVSSAGTVGIRHNSTARKTMASASSSSPAPQDKSRAGALSKSGQTSSDTSSSLMSSSVDSDSREKGDDASVKSDGSSAGGSSTSLLSSGSSAGERRSARKSFPGKTARKSMSMDRGRGDGDWASTVNKPVSISNMTLQLSEIEKTLGIKTLNNIDAKTLDKLILEKARTPRREVSSRSRTASPDVVAKNEPSTSKSTPAAKESMISILKKNNVIAIKRQPEKTAVSDESKKTETKADGNNEIPKVVAKKRQPEKAALGSKPEQTETKTDGEHRENKEEVPEKQPAETSEVVQKETETLETEVEPANTETITEESESSSAQTPRKKRKRRLGGYDLPGKKKSAKSKTVQYVKPKPKGKVAVKGTKAAQAKSVITGDTTPGGHLDDSYETMDELEVSQSEETPSVVAAKKEVTVAAVTCSPVLQRVGDSPGMLKKNPLSVKKVSGKSRPVLGSKKTPAAAGALPAINKPAVITPAVNKPAVNTPKRKKERPEKKKKKMPKQSKPLENSTPQQVEPEVESLSPAHIINPHSHKPYKRGPYKKRKSKGEVVLDGEVTDGGDVAQDTSVEGGVKQETRRPNTSLNTSPILEVLSNTLAHTKAKGKSKKGAEAVVLEGALSPSRSPGASRKRPRGFVAVSKAKRQKLAGFGGNKGLKVAMQCFFKKKLKLVPPKSAPKVAKVSSPPSTTIGGKVVKQQRSVMDMFTELNRRRSATQGENTEPTEEIPEKPVEEETHEEEMHEDTHEGEVSEMIVEPEPEPLVVNTATQIDRKGALDTLEELTDPEFTPLEDPALMDLPSLRQSTRTPTTLAELKATLDAEAEEQQPLRKKRKRRGVDGDPSGDGSDSVLSSQAKRPKTSGCGLVGDASLGVQPLSLQPEHTAQLNPSKQSERAAVATSRSSSSNSVVQKYVNTPNGVQYPVTPPKTPEGSVGSAAAQDRATPQLMSPLVRERDYLPLCCCRINGASFKPQATTIYCQALDSMDGRVVGCCNKVTSAQLIRPAVKIPFMAICEVHRKRHKLHHCCPGCGHFCTQGTFLQCKKDCSAAVHHYHRQCQVYKDSKYYCPHCGEESVQYEVHLQLHDPRNVSFFPRAPTKHNTSGPKARIGSSTRPRLSSEGKSDTEKDDEISFKLPTGKELKSSPGGQKWGPSRVELANAITLLKGEKPKKLRTGPKSLYYGAKACDVERVVFMLADGCDPNYKIEEQENQTALHAAAYSGNPTIMHLLVQAGGEVRTCAADLETPLMIAAEQGHLDCLQYLVRAGALVDARRDDGMTGLHLAAKSGHLEVCKFLLASTDMDINVVDDGGWTALIWAAEHKHRDCVKFLLKQGGEPNIRDNEENTALHWAVFAGSVDIAELFLDAGCDVECPNEHGDRALHIASRQGHYECVVLLLARGADSDVRNNENETPLSSCIEQEGTVWMALKVNLELKVFAAKRLQQPTKLLHRDISMGRESNPIPVVNDCDDENYPTDFHYVHENVETSPMMVNRVISSLQHCGCKDDCSSVFCQCGRNSVRCWYTKEGRLESEFNQSEPPLVFECNKACKCWSTCRNRVVQLGITCRLEVFRTIGRGWGVRTKLDIKQGTFVCEYIGEHISDDEADAREDDSYLFDLDNKDTDTFCIDARRYANVARFINHLCHPNLMPVKVFIEHQDLRFPRICFFASRDIHAGEELGFDYGERFWIIKWKEFTCACKSPKCKYSSETIQQTIADYNRRQQEDEAVDNLQAV